MAAPDPSSRTRFSIPIVLLILAIVTGAVSLSLKLKLLDRYALQAFAYRVGETIPDFELVATLAAENLLFAVLWIGLAAWFLEFREIRLR